MYRVIGFFLLVMACPLTAHADCRFESVKQFKRAAEAEDWIKYRTRKTYTCLPSTDTTGQPAWGCEEGAGDRGRQCEMLSNITRSRDFGPRSIYPRGEGTYESWPSGQRYRCDKAFGCRPEH
jgi:hypothetical protein